MSNKKLIYVKFSSEKNRKTEIRCLGMCDYIMRPWSGIAKIASVFVINEAKIL